MKLDINYERFFNDETVEQENLSDDYKIIDKNKKLFKKPEETKFASNCKSDEAEYLLSHGRVSETYMMLKEKADARHSKFKARLSLQHCF